MIKITAAENSDRFFLSEVCIDTVQTYDSILPGAFEKQAKKFSEEGLPKTYDIGIVKLEDLKLGFVGFVRLDNETLYLTAVYLLEVYQRQGYGKKIINTIEKEAYKEGIKRVVLLVHSKATWAIDFYEKNGFYVIEIEENKIKEYADSRMAKYFLPSTILMGKMLKCFGE
ncbi:GCN5-related N-acetyltransferase [Alkaliphilus metalliredigens QYMF]|uniref:GCN5-related N-acetyltransferase n=1 Tax=Alkaliphilus metalliredigens (strain QYMF) TaxID=293826 RepID=A6TQE2_ALKMQ|nr:GNAT family N-acetyltransferase [Alkaliphilus metalliredigens]ABR48410.1 GCN5-related N-acetyltransferase [Alkaliphilus metalliredigens QYMF]